MDGYRRYRVQGRERCVEMICDAIEASGARILEKPDPREAPFHIKVQRRDGLTLDLLCYAFTANKYQQANRPEDEHRFQIKYGSEFGSEDYHEIHICDGAAVTLMFGVHLEEKIFIAVDPGKHNPTRFSKSVEFKTEHLEKALTTGWYSWERPRNDARRNRPMPGYEEENYQTEALLAFKPEKFMEYVEFEKSVAGLDTGMRMIAIEEMSKRDSGKHPLELIYGLSAYEILDVISGAKRLEVAVRGGVAQRHLEEQLRKLEDIETVQPIDKDAAGDFRIVYHKKDYFIECKNVLRELQKGFPKVDFQKTRAAQGNPCSRYYKREAFDVLAACLYPVSERWEFRFCGTMFLEEHKTCKGHLSQHVLVNGDRWHESVFSAIAVQEVAEAH